MSYLVILTASHITSLNKFNNGLIPMLESIHRFDEIKEHYLSISSTIDLDLSVLSKYPKLKIIKSSVPLKQFQHLSNIIKTINFSDNEYIMMIDDDDILLQIPEKCKERKSIKGIQYVPTLNNSTDNTETIGYQNFEDIRKKCTVENDFSGYCSTFKIIKEYFENIKTDCKDSFDNVFLTLGDLKYMDHLDKFGAVSVMPFIYHKLWYQESNWSDTLSEEMKECEDEVRGLKEKLNLMQEHHIKLKDNISDLKDNISNNISNLTKSSDKFEKISGSEYKIKNTEYEVKT